MYLQFKHDENLHENSKLSKIIRHKLNAVTIDFKLVKMCLIKIAMWYYNKIIKGKYNNNKYKLEISKVIIKIYKFLLLSLSV